MIYLVTGVPGSGKSLYAVSTLIKKLMADVVKSDGTVVKRRLLVDGIPELLVPHELMAPTVLPDEDCVFVDENGDTKSSLDKPFVRMPEGGNGVGNWPDWVLPGDVLLIDECQRLWRPRGLGTKPPFMIKALETHRHKGIDIVILTQNPMLIDQNVRRLVGRHIHVRRLFGMARAILYDWDGCSVDVHRTKSATSSTWAYPKDGYKLYKSSELHTKQKQKIPLWLALPVVALVAGLVVAPKAFSTLFGAASGRGVSSSAAVSVPGSGASAVSSSMVESLNPVSAVSVVVPRPGASVSGGDGLGEDVADSVPVEVVGCARSVDLCRCYTDTAKFVEKPLSYCEAETTFPVVKVSSAQLQHVPDSLHREEIRPDLDLIAWASRRR